MLSSVIKNCKYPPPFDAGPFSSSSIGRSFPYSPSGDGVLGLALVFYLFFFSSFIFLLFPFSLFSLFFSFFSFLFFFFPFWSLQMWATSTMGSFPLPSSGQRRLFVPSCQDLSFSLNSSPLGSALLIPRHLSPTVLLSFDIWNLGRPAPGKILSTVVSFSRFETINTFSPNLS